MCDEVTPLGIATSSIELEALVNSKKRHEIAV
jgi:hypothetical protein